MTKRELKQKNHKKMEKAGRKHLKKKGLFGKKS
jgi:hypothetical protein